MPYTTLSPQEAVSLAQPKLTNTDRLVNATHRLMQAERTGDADAIQKAEACQAFYKRQVLAEGARERMALAAAAEVAEMERQEATL